jgi:NitT/TauT family transport system substrate-binding protein
MSPTGCCAPKAFNDVQHILRTVPEMSDAIGRGEVDLSLHFVANLILAIEAGLPITILAGVHVGCFELFANETIHGIRDLKGKRVGVQGLGVQAHAFLTSNGRLCRARSSQRHRLGS